MNFTSYFLTTCGLMVFFVSGHYLRRYLRIRQRRYLLVAIATLLASIVLVLLSFG
jgi:threonine/homoserine/homoserine lactone efflux protein